MNKRKTRRRPRRTLKQKLNRTIRLLREKNRLLQADNGRLTRQLDTTRAQMRETVEVNHHNAAAHRASEVAALMSNVAQNAEIERLRLQLPGAKRRAIESVEMPAIRVPAPIPVQQPALKSP